MFENADMFVLLIQTLLTGGILSSGQDTTRSRKQVWRVRLYWNAMVGIARSEVILLLLNWKLNWFSTHSIVANFAALFDFVFLCWRGVSSTTTTWRQCALRLIIYIGFHPLKTCGQWKPLTGCTFASVPDETMDLQGDACWFAQHVTCDWSGTCQFRKIEIILRIIIIRIDAAFLISLYWTSQASLLRISKCPEDLCNHCRLPPFVKGSRPCGEAIGGLCQKRAV